MPVQVTLLCYVLLMLSLAVIVKWEAVRRRKGPSLKAKDFDQFNTPRISYTPPPARSNRSFDSLRR